MAASRTELPAYRRTLGTIEVKRFILQGNWLFPLIFVMSLTPLVLFRKKATGIKASNKMSTTNNSWIISNFLVIINGN